MFGMSDVAQMIDQARQGDPQTADQLLPLVYHELRRLAAVKLAGEKPGQTLNATALVHEAYLRLVARGDAVHWTDQRHFFASAAEAMRRIILDHARRKRSQKRGRNHGRVEFDETALPAPQPPEDLIEVDQALTRLSTTDPEAAELVKLRYFAGLSMSEAAAVLCISPRSADRLWAYARAYLREAIDNL
jgi:RNA polymerase sigma factor (TIGR02999 family)